MKTSTILSAVLGATILSGPALAETVTLFGYSGVFQERYTEAVIKPFMAANPDITVEFFPVQGSAAILGTLRAQKASPQADVAILDVSVAKTGSDEGLFQPIDETVSANVADLYPGARFTGVAGVGITFDNLVMMYNPKQVATPPTSWGALQDAAYEGKVGMLGAPDLVGVGLTVVLDHIAGGGDPASGLAGGIEALEKISPNVQTWDPKPEVYQAVANGQIALGVGWNARTQLTADLSDGRLAAVLPEEGTILQINTLNLVKDGPAPEAARTFVDYALGADAQAAFAKAMYYAPTNSKARVAPEVIDRTVASSMDRTIPLDWIALAPARDKITEQWRRKVIPLSR